MCGSLNKFFSFFVNIAFSPRMPLTSSPPRGEFQDSFRSWSLPESLCFLKYSIVESTGDLTSPEEKLSSWELIIWNLCSLLPQTPHHQLNNSVAVSSSITSLICLHLGSFIFSTPFLIWFRISGRGSREIIRNQILGKTSFPQPGKRWFSTKDKGTHACLGFLPCPLVPTF